MKRHPFLRLGLVFFLLLLLLYSVSEADNLQEAIVGKWRSEKGGKIIEYLEDGTLLGADGITGNYKVLSDGRLKVEVVFPFLGRMVDVLKVSIGGNKLTTIDRQGRVDIFWRVKNSASTEKDTKKLRTEDTPKKETSVQTEAPLYKPASESGDKIATEAELERLGNLPVASDEELKRFLEVEKTRAARATGSSDYASKILKLRREAGESNKSQRWQEVIDAYQKILAMDQEDWGAFSMLANSYNGVGSPDKSLEYALKALQKIRYKTLFAIVAEAYGKKGNKDKALLWLEKALRGGFTMSMENFHQTFPQYGSDPEYNALLGKYGIISTSSTIQEDSKSSASASDNFNILGVRLGMTPQDVEKVKPEFRSVTSQWGVRIGGFTRYENYKKNNNPTEFLACAGTGCGMITDWEMKVEVAGEPYGNGVFKIDYQKYIQGNVDTAIFISELKKQLEEKYGKASFQKITMQDLARRYYACWGKHCSEIEKKDYSEFNRYFQLGGNDASLPEGKYLLVSFPQGYFPTRVKFNMFDTSPYHVQKIEEERRAAEAARKKIEF